MTLKEAINTITQVCASYRGTLQDHNLIQSALNLIKATIEKDKEQQKSETDRIEK